VFVGAGKTRGRDQLFIHERVSRMTIEELQAKRESILSAIAKENSRLESGSNALTKRSVQEMQQALAVIDNEIAKLQVVDQASSTGAVPGLIGGLYSRDGL